MKKIILIAAAVIFGTMSSLAQFGKWQPAEWQKVIDEQTGVELTVLTDTLKNDKFIYQTDPMWSYDLKYLMFRSSSRGAKGEERTLPDGRKVSFAPTNTYFIEVATGRIIQATEGLGGYLANRSNKLFINRNEGGKWNMYVMDLEKFFADADKGKVKKSQDEYMTFIGTFPDSKEMGRPGSFCVSSEDDYAYITVSREGTQEEIDESDDSKCIDKYLAKLARKHMEKEQITVGDVNLVDMDDMDYTKTKVLQSAKDLFIYNMVGKLSTAMVILFLVS